MKLRLLRACLAAVLGLAIPGRAAAALFVVDDAADPAPITGTLTLRQAITLANSQAGPHTIVFQIPGVGAQTILLTGPLPALRVDQIMIDGFSQPGASDGLSPPVTAQILIQLDGALAGPCHGLHVLSSFNTFRGLAVTNFAWDGIRIEGTAMPGTRGNTVYACFVGTDPTGGFAMGNGAATSGGIWAGVDILCTPGPTVTYCFDNVVDRSLVSGNLRCGVQIASCPPSDCYANTVVLSHVGTDRSGLFALGNAGSGIVLAEGTHDNNVYLNVASANAHNGIDLTGNPLTMPPASTTHNQMLGNNVGVGMDGVTPLGNGARGVSLGIFETSTFFAGFVPENTVVSCVIAHNGLAGVSVWEHPLGTMNADRNWLSNNVLHWNGGLGIDLGDDGVTPNDPGDLDTGANEQLDAPVVRHAHRSSGGFVTVGGFAAPGRTVDVYRAAPDPSGYGEGDLVLGSVLADANGNWSMQTWSLVPGDFVTALAHEPSPLVWTNTSEFAAIVPVTALAEAGGGAPLPFGLWPGGANPFRGATSLRWSLPAAAPATLRVLDVRGALVRTLADGVSPAGERLARWDGRDGGGRTVAAGVYFVELRSGGERAVRRVVRL